MLSPEQCIGEIDASTVPKEAVVQSDEEARIEKAIASRPRLVTMITIADFEVCFDHQQIDDDLVKPCVLVQ
jgi:hypothetical protein